MSSRAYRILEPLFEDMILGPDGQGVFMSKQHWSKLLDMVPDEDLRAQLNKRWASTDSSTPGDKWRELVAGVEGILRKNKPSSGVKRPLNGDAASGGNKRAELRTCLQEIVLAYLYPRLDANVSKQRNHLLKSPFAVHPNTGRVSVPVGAEDIESFDPFQVPTLGQLQEELNQSNGEGSESGRSASMEKYVDQFEAQLLKPLDADARRKQRDAKESDAAFNGDW